MSDKIRYRDWREAAHEAEKLVLGGASEVTIRVDKKTGAAILTYKGRPKQSTDFDNRYYGLI